MKDQSWYHQKRNYIYLVMAVLMLGIGAGLVFGYRVAQPEVQNKMAESAMEADAARGKITIYCADGSVKGENGCGTKKEEKDIKELKEEKGLQRVPLPEEVRGIYWTAVTAGSSRGDELLGYMKETGLNAVVLDLKMDNGALAFDPHDDSMDRYMQAKPYMTNLDERLEELGEEGIYRIARIAVMRDGIFALEHPDQAMHWAGGGLWRDAIGSLWVDPASEEVAEYAIKLGKEAYARGFDEVQYDYVRFASDGAISSISFPVYDYSETKVEVMQRFFKKVGGDMQAAGIPVSFDLFGMTYLRTDDFNIGQRLQDVLPYADFVSPMAYPSHYPNGFLGFANPALAPYEVIKHTVDTGVELMQDIHPNEDTKHKTRVWIQDFDIGAVYTSGLIEAQIDAVRDSGGSGWMLWNARNVYERANYLKEE